MFRIIFKTTFQSAILFFTISFLTVLYDILPEWINLPKKTDYNIYEITIGFPFQYYERFWLDCDAPNHSWNFNNLFYNCLIFWIATFIFYLIKDRKNYNQEKLKK